MNREPLTNRKAIENLNRFRVWNDKNDMWTTFFLGTPLCMGNKRVYRTKGAAKARVIDFLSYYPNSSSREDVKKIVANLEQKGMLEIRTIDDTSPKFPHNVPGIDIEQAEKLKTMAGASDPEMVDLAITILEKLK